MKTRPTGDTTRWRHGACGCNAKTLSQLPNNRPWIYE